MACLKIDFPLHNRHVSLLILYWRWSHDHLIEPTYDVVIYLCVWYEYVSLYARYLLVYWQPLTLNVATHYFLALQTISRCFIVITKQDLSNHGRSSIVLVARKYSKINIKFYVDSPVDIMIYMAMIGLPCGYHYAYEKKIVWRYQRGNQTPNDQKSMTKRKRTNNELQNTTQKSKDRATQTPLKTRGELMCFGRVNSSCSTSGTCRVTIATNMLLTEIQARNVFIFIL